MICHKCDWEGDNPKVCDRSVTMFYVCPECGFYVVESISHQQADGSAAQAEPGDEAV